MCAAYTDESSLSQSIYDCQLEVYRYGFDFLKQESAEHGKKQTIERADGQTTYGAKQLANTRTHSLTVLL